MLGVGEGIHGRCGQFVLDHRETGDADRIVWFWIERIKRHGTFLGR